MTKTILTFGALFVAIGVFSYFASGGASVTALIPAFFGLVFLIFSAVAHYKPNWSKAMTIATAVLAVLGIGGTAKGLMSFVSWLGGTEVARPLAVSVQAGFCVLSAVLLILALRSLLTARKTA